VELTPGQSGGVSSSSGSGGSGGSGSSLGGGLGSLGPNVILNSEGVKIEEEGGPESALMGGGSAGGRGSGSNVASLGDLFNSRGSAKDDGFGKNGLGKDGYDKFSKKGRDLAAIKDVLNSEQDNIFRIVERRIDIKEDQHSFDLPPSNKVSDTPDDSGAGAN